MLKSKLATILAILILIVAELAIFQFVPNVNALTGNPVGMSTTYYALSYPIQWNGFYYNNRFWAFYTDGTNMVYESTADPSNWSGSVTSIATAAYGYYFAIYFDGTYVHYVRYASYKLYYRRGTPNANGTITWSTDEQTVYSGISTDYYGFPQIAVDSNGYAWIGCRYYYYDVEAEYYPYVIKNSKNDGTWQTEFATRLSSTSNVGWRVQVVPLTAGKVYAIYAYTGSTIYGKLYSGSWGAQESDLADYPVQGYYSFSAVSKNDDVYLTYTRATTYQIRYNKRTYGAGWGANDVLVQDSVSSATAPALSVNTVNGNLYCFWMVSSHVYYKKNVDGTWDTDPTDWMDESGDTIGYNYALNSWSQAYSGYLGLLYVTKSASPYNIKFAYLTVAAGDNIPPNLVDFYVNTTWAGFQCEFAFQWSDNVGLSTGILETNKTGSPANETAVTTSGTMGWTNWTVTLPNYNCLLEFKAYVNDSDNYWCSTGSRYLRVYTYNAPLNQTRYFTGEDVTKNGIATNYLNASLYGNVENASWYCSDPNAYSYIGIKVKRRFWYIDVWNEVVISPAYPIAVAQLPPRGIQEHPGPAIYSGTWTFNSISLDPRDTIKIEVYMGNTSTPTDLIATFTTEVLDIVTLYNYTWTVHYFCYVHNDTYWMFEWGNTTYPSKILNFTTVKWNPYYQTLIEALSDISNAVDWSNNGTIYPGTILSKKNYTDLEGWIDYLAATQQWREVIHWSAICWKLGIKRETAIKNALDNYSMICNDSLPENTEGHSFLPSGEWALYGFYFAEYYDYALIKWNITKAYEAWHERANPDTHSWAVKEINQAGETTYADRYWVEVASTGHVYLMFETLLNVTGGLENAVKWWDKTQGHWDPVYENYKYQSSAQSPSFIWEAPFFVRDISILKYYVADIGNWSRVLTDVYNRYLKNKWDSWQWLTQDNYTTYFTVHSYGSGQRGLDASLGTWFMLLGIYPKLNTTMQDKIRAMLFGNLSCYPAWMWMISPHGQMYDSSSKLFTWTNVNPSYTSSATAYALLMMFLQGMIPATTSIIFPLEELDWFYYKDIDTECFKINITARKIKIAVNGNGIITFQFGLSPVNYTFTEGQGIYELVFSSSWNLITSVSKIGDVPSGRIYFTQLQDDPPQFSNTGATTTKAGEECTFYALWTDDWGLSGYIFGTNNTGTWINDTFVSMSGTQSWSNVTKTLNSSTGVRVEWQIWCKDTNNNWNTTGIQYLVTAQWRNIEQWKVNLRNIIWSLAETWFLTLRNPAWFTVENWMLTLYTLKWFAVEQWNLNVRNPFWTFVETWFLTLRSPTWFTIENWIVSLRNLTWFNVENWLLSLHTLKWFNVEQWTLTLRNPIWNFAEQWLIKVKNYSWFTVETWILHFGTGIWNIVEQWLFTLRNATWFTIETWLTELIIPSWHLIEQWMLQLGTGFWNPIETWTLSIRNPYWNFIEQWLLTVGMLPQPPLWFQDLKSFLIVATVIFMGCFLFYEFTKWRW